jgi:hypothetical protein
VDDVPPLSAAYGKAPTGKDRIGLSEAIVRDGQTLMAMEGFPLLVARNEGAGRVVFVAFDMAGERFQSWPNLQRLYWDLIERRGTLPVPTDTRLAAAAALDLNTAIGVPVLPRWALGVCLAANLGCVLIVLYALRKRREWAFVVLVAAAPVLALTVNLLGGVTVSSAETGLTSLNVIESASGERHGSLSSFYALLAASEGQCQIRWPGAMSVFGRGLPPVVAHTGPRRITAGAVLESPELADEDLKELRRLHLRPRTISMFESNCVTALPGAIKTEASVGPDGIRFRVKNNSPARLSHVLAAFNRNAVPMNDLAPGETGTALLTRATARGMTEEFASKAYRSKPEVERDRIIGSLHSPRRVSDVADTGAHVFGWMNETPLGVEVVGLPSPPRLSAQTVWAVAADTATGKGRLLLPKGTAAMQFMDTESGVFAESRWLPVAKTVALDVAFGVPLDAVGMKASRIEFFLRLGQSPADAAVEALIPETGEYQTIFGRSSSAGAIPEAFSWTSLSLPSPDRYLSRTTGKVILRVTIKPPMASAKLGGVRRPVVEDFDLEIEGTRE